MLSAVFKLKKKLKKNHLSSSLEHSLLGGRIINAQYW